MRAPSAPAARGKRLRGVIGLLQPGEFVCVRTAALDTITRLLSPESLLQFEEAGELVVVHLRRGAATDGRRRRSGSLARGFARRWRGEVAPDGGEHRRAECHDRDDGVLPRRES